MSISSSTPSSASANFQQAACSIQMPPSISQLRRSQRGRIMFPLRLHTMLSDAEVSGFADVICWQPHGRCFVVHDPHDFVSRLAPMYFSQSKWSSFQRQLNVYGFIRLSDGPDKGGYYHVSFLRGHPWLCDWIKRTTFKGTRVGATVKPAREPDFYAMPSLDSVSAENMATHVETRSLDDNPVSKLMQTSSVNMSLQLKIEPEATFVPNRDTSVPQRYDEHNIPCDHHTWIHGQSSLHTMAHVADGFGDSQSCSGHEPPVAGRYNMAQLVPTPSLHMSTQQMTGLQAGFLAQPDSIVLEPDSLRDESLGNGRMLSDDPIQLQYIFATDGNSFNFDELDELPDDDQEWWDLLESHVSLT